MTWRFVFAVYTATLLVLFGAAMIVWGLIELAVRLWRGHRGRVAAGRQASTRA